MAAHLPMRVAQVVPWLTARAGGTSAIVVNLTKALQNIGVSVTVYTTDMAVAAQSTELRRGVTIADLPDGASDIAVRIFPVRQPYRLVFSPELQRSLRSDLSEFDVVHIHSLFLHPQFAGWKEASRAGVPWVVSPRGALDPYLRQRGKMRKRLTDLLWQRRMLDNASALHLTSEEESLQIQDLAFKAPHRIVPNGLDTRIFRGIEPSGELRASWLSGTDGPVIMNHGRISGKKGLDILIDAFAQLKQSFRGAKLVVIGPDDEGLSAGLRQQAHELGIAQDIHFPGPMYGSPLVEALASCDVWVLPSHGENFGTAMVEAMASGRPVVVSPQVNIAEEAQRAGAVMMVNNTPDELAGALQNLLGSRELQESLGSRAREYAGRYDWASVAHQYRDLYASLR